MGDERSLGLTFFVSTQVQAGYGRLTAVSQ